DFGGLLTQAELDALIARKDDIAKFVNSGSGIVALAESGLGAGLTRRDAGHFSWLPIQVDRSTNNVPPYRTTDFGKSVFGLVDGDVGSPSHNFFFPVEGLDVVSIDARDQIMSLAGTVGIGDTGFVKDGIVPVTVVATDPAGNSTEQTYSIDIVRGEPQLAIE